MKRVQSNKLDFSGQNIYVGIDVHLKSWSVAILSEHSVLKRFSQSPEPEALHKYLVSNYPGANYFSVYEAGFVVLDTRKVDGFRNNQHRGQSC